MTRLLEKLKEDVCRANKDLVKHGLVLFTWGNVSAIDRGKGIIAIKPSGVDYNVLTPDDIVLVDIAGNIVEGEKKPSTDTAAHIEIYAGFQDAVSVIHTHSTHATIFAQARKPIICLGTTHADHFYGDVPVTRDLTKEEIVNNYERSIGKVIVEHFSKNKINPIDMPACLVANHGPFVWGKSIKSAVCNAKVLDEVAKMALETARLNSFVQPIDSFLLDKHYKRKYGENAYYGQK